MRWLDLATYLYLALGGGMLLLVLIDVFWTAVAPRGAGPLTAKSGVRVWRLAMRIHRKWGAEWLVETLGPVFVVGVIALWGVLLWVGWTLIFSSQFGTLSADDAPLDLFGRLYFVGYSLLTLGIGDYVPRPGAWQIATILASANGLTVVTLGVTYILNVLESVTDARGMASSFYDLGTSPSKVLTGAWEGEEGWGALSDHLVAAAPSLALHAEQHQAFPVLHYFHSRQERTNTVLRVAVLAEAAHLLEGMVAPSARLPRSVTGPLLSAVDGYLETLLDLYSQDEAPETEELPPWDLDALREAGIPLADADERRQCRDRHAERRVRLCQLLASDGWDADTVLRGREPASARPTEG